MERNLPFRVKEVWWNSGKGFYLRSVGGDWNMVPEGAAFFPLATCYVIRYHLSVIKSFRHKGLRDFYYTGNKAGIQAKHSERLRLILARLDASIGPGDMNLSGLRLHKLTGQSKDFWAVEVSGNWRVIFRLEKQDAIKVDYLDYH